MLSSPHKGIEVYGIPNCVHCRNAENLLKEKEKSFGYTDITSLSQDDLVNLVSKIAPGAKTAPIVIVEGVWIGGFTELKEYLK